MATKHNITVAIEPSLLKKARATAASRGRSVSALLADELRELVAEDARYLSARKRALALFSSPLPLGGAPLNREDLHERRRLAPAGCRFKSCRSSLSTSPKSWRHPSRDRLHARL
jgi:hypothetical protein